MVEGTRKVTYQPDDVQVSFCPYTLSFLYMPQPLRLDKSIRHRKHCAHEDVDVSGGLDWSVLRVDRYNSCYTCMYVSTSDSRKVNFLLYIVKFTVCDLVE